jgi:predicted kinase
MLLTIVRGIPGTGKSTFAKKLIDPMTIVLEADMYFIADTGEYDFNVQNLGRAHDWCLHTTKSFLRSGYDVVVANTFTTWKEISSYIRFAITNEIEYSIVTLTKEYGSIHNVPDESMIRMRDRFQSHQHIVDTIDLLQKEFDSSNSLNI